MFLTCVASGSRASRHVPRAVYPSLGAVGGRWTHPDFIPEHHRPPPEWLPRQPIDMIFGYEGRFAETDGMRNSYFATGVAAPALQSRAAMYRRYLQHMRLIPDPYVWSVLIPRMRKLCASDNRAADYGEEVKGADGDYWRQYESEFKQAKTQIEADAVWSAEEKKVALRAERRKRSLKRAREELNYVRGAVACHPFAFLRILEGAYGQIGPLRYKMLRNLAATSPPPAPHAKAHLLGETRPDIPAILESLKRRAVAPQPSSNRATRYVTPKLGAARARDDWLREQAKTPVPIVIPQPPSSDVEFPRTGLEGKYIAESLYALVGDEATVGRRRPDPPVKAESQYISREPERTDLPNPSALPTFALLSPVLQKIFPNKLIPTRREPAYPRPPPGATKENPRKWGYPRELNPRLFQRIYRRFWDNLHWVWPVQQKGKTVWVPCSYQDVRAFEAGNPDAGQRDQVGRKRDQSALGFNGRRYSLASEDDLSWAD